MPSNARIDSPNFIYRGNRQRYISTSAQPPDPEGSDIANPNQAVPLFMANRRLSTSHMKLA